MLKKMFKLSSPVGIALAVAGVVLALSPEARQATRRVVVKGTAALLGAIDSVKQTVAEAVPQEVAKPVAGTLASGVGALNAGTDTAVDAAKDTVDETADTTAALSRQATDGAAHIVTDITDAPETIEHGAEYH